MESTVAKDHVRVVSRAEPVLVALAGAVLAVLGCAVFLGGCDKATEPKPVKYNIYIGSAETDQLYVLDAESLTVRDSIPGLGGSFDMLVSPDGRWLYVETHPNQWGNMLTKVDALARQEVASLPSPGGTRLAMLMNGELILRGGSFYTEVIDPVDLTVVRTIDDSLRWRDGPQSGTKIAVGYFPGGNEGPSRIRVLDVETGELSGDYIPHLQTGEPIGAYQVALHPDERRVIAAGPGFGGCWILIGDVITGETLLQLNREGCNGEIAISPDSSLAVVSDPSVQGYPEMPDPVIDVLDLRNLRHLKRFTPVDLATSDYNSQIQFTSDSRRVIIAPRPGMRGRVHVIDLKTLRVEDTVWPDTGRTIVGALGYGPRPR